jgi:tetratricopeptide (TPR) repeat protein
MKFLAPTAVALIAVTTPAYAQYGSSYSGQPGATAVPQQPQQQQQQQQGQPAQNSGPQPSSKARKAIVDLQTAVNANDLANIPAKLAAANAVASTKEDHYWIARLQLKAAVAANNVAGEAAAVDALASSGLVSSSEMATFYGAIGAEYYKAKQFDQAVASFQKQSQLAPGSTDALVNIAEIRASQGRAADAVSTLQQVIQASAAAGKKPEEAVYRRAVALAYQGKLPNTMDVARQWVTAYPNDTSWHDVISIYRNLHPADSSNLTDVFRLASATNALQEGSDYEIYAATTAEAANYGEAKAVVDAGIAAGKIKATDKTIASVLAVSKGKIPTEAELAAAEKGAAIPTAYLRVGDRYYGAGNYAKAAALYKEALSKGADANLTNLRLGEALARSGDKAGAAAALNAVSGPQADIAKLWLLYAQRQA